MTFVCSSSPYWDNVVVVVVVVVAVLVLVVLFGRRFLQIDEKHFDACHTQNVALFV